MTYMWPIVLLIGWTAVGWAAWQLYRVFRDEHGGGF